MLVPVATDTIEYISRNPKEKRKSKGQFFTCASTAKFMSDLFTIEKKEIRLLDPGAGTGILSVAAIEKFLDSDKIESVSLDLFENDKSILPMLIKNMEQLKDKCHKADKEFHYKVFDENFILYFSDFWQRSTIGSYDGIISNPPYIKIGKTEPEAWAMKSVVYGQPNMYFLFMAMSAKLLNKEGEMIFIVPRSFVSGLYFLEFRKYLLNEVKIKNIHLFVSRNKIFKTENVLQETIIIKAKKTTVNSENICISTSNTTDEFENQQYFDLPYKSCIEADNNYFIRLPSSEKDIKTLKKLNTLKHSLKSIGFRAKTGLVVDFRATAYLKNEEDEDTVPLIWPQNFHGGIIRFDNSKVDNQYITVAKKSLLMNNGNYLLIKRFSAKEEKRRLQPALYFAENSNRHEFISTENHLNFIVKSNGENLSKEEAWGLYVIFNSTLWDIYFRILNGSTQVNSNELSSIPLPDKDILIKIGKAAEKKNALATHDCDALIGEYIEWAS